MEVKKCTKCGVEKDFDCFSKRKAKRDHLRSECKECNKKYDKERYANPENNERLRKQHRKYLIKPEVKKHIKQQRKEYKREYNARPEIRARFQNDIQYKLACNLRSRLRTALKNKAKVGSAVSDCGCTMEALKYYLELHFQPGMTWDNWALDGWHIDHIRPLASFDLTDRNQLLAAVHYSNLQPLWAIDNLKKGDKILGPQVVL